MHFSITKYKFWIYIVFFAVLLAVFYWAINEEHVFTDSPLAVINSSIPAFQFTDQNGQSFSQKNTEGKVYVANYFFTSCKGICPKMNTNMRRIYEAFKDEPDFLIASHTCMPEVDTMQLLKIYEVQMAGGSLVKTEQGSYKIIHSATDILNTNYSTHWKFLTGEKKELYQLARQGYMIDNGKPDSTQNIQDQFIHTQFFALVDRYGRVRGIYDGLKEDEIQKLLKDIPGLLKEKIDHARFMNGFSNTPG